MSVVYIAGDFGKIVIDGDLQEEFHALRDCYLAFSDGSVVFIQYDDGVWRISPIFIDPDSDYLKEFEAEESIEKEGVYSDVARLSNSYGFKWVVLGDKFSKRRRPDPVQMELPGV